MAKDGLDKALDQLEKLLPYILLLIGIYIIVSTLKDWLKPQSTGDYPTYDPNNPCPYGNTMMRGYFGGCPPNYVDNPDNWWKFWQTPQCTCSSSVR